MTAADCLCDVLPLMATHVGLLGVGSLAASSKQLRAACSDILPQDATTLLLDAVLQASATAVAAKAAKAARAAARYPVANDAVQHKVTLKQQAQAVQWLLQLHPSAATTAGALDRLLHIPAVPAAIARVLIASGVRITFAQLVAAANSMVEGVEVWAQLMSNVHALEPEQCDMPTATFAICCPSCWVS
jgi:hypothetical protein